MALLDSATILYPPVKIPFREFSCHTIPSRNQVCCHYFCVLDGKQFQDVFFKAAAYFVVGRADGVGVP